MSREQKFFITTPIYYTNGIPHIGHAYSTMIADVIARYHKISGKDVKFSTGVDENSQKIIQTAEAEGRSIESYLDSMASKHKEVWDGLGIEYTDFIRTTEPRHHSLVQEVMQKSFDAGDIYQGEYEGKYCVGCEAFKKDDDLIERDAILVCPDHLKEPDIIKEKNYFFKLSKYEDTLLKFYEECPDFVQPRERFNEVIAFVKRWLEDFSVSREGNTFGIRLPFDSSQVSYVWYDALFNYITVCQDGDEDFWPANLHVVGKDIIRFHAIYWPAMLMSAGYELPKNILTTGFFTVDGQKISKSLGNAIDPVEFSQTYSKDMLLLYLLSNFHIGQDWDFDQHNAILTYNAKLANNLGNLVNRVVVLALKLDDSTLTSKKDRSDLLISDSKIEELKKLFSNYELKDLLDSCFHLLDKLNKYADENEPWKLVKTDPETARVVLFALAEWLRLVGCFLYPFFPEKMSEMFLKLGLENYSEELESGKLNELLQKKEAFAILEKWEALFKRFDVE